jgi:hypothetical protein
MTGKSSVRFITTAVLASTFALSASGCTLLYPHWGETTAPIVTPSNSASNSASASPSNTPSTTPSATASTTPRATAKVMISSVNVDSSGGVVDIIAEVTNVSEDGGQCTVRLVSGTVAKSLTVKAEQNATDTQCFPMEFNISDLPSGNAVLSVIYQSPAFIGTSAAQAVVIP